MRIGVDFDNTIAGYDHVFTALALEAGLIPESLTGGKRAVRDALRRRAGGEVAWQKLQAQAYGRRMAEAELIPGVDGFLRACHRDGISVYVVSHKTRYAKHDADRIDLRHAASAWMEDKGFFADDGFGLAPGQVFFEGTRAEKLARIGALGVSHFVDDLEEVLCAAGFPGDVQAILYRPHESEGEFPDDPGGRVAVFDDWHLIAEHLLGTRT